MPDEALIIVVLERHTNVIRPDSLSIAADGTVTLTVLWDGIQPEYAEEFPATSRIVPKTVKVIHVETAIWKRRIAAFRLCP